MFRILSFMVAALAVVMPSRAGEALTPDSARNMLSRLPLHEIEGIWRMTADEETTVVVMRDDDGGVVPSSYRILLLKGSDRSVAPGTLLGTLSPTAQPSTFEALVFTSVNTNGEPSKPKRFTVKLVDRAHMSFTKVKSGISVSPLALFPYIFRRAVKIENDRPRNLDGLIKTYPSGPVEGCPRYL